MKIDRIVLIKEKQLHDCKSNEEDISSRDENEYWKLSGILGKFKFRNTSLHGMQILQVNLFKDEVKKLWEKQERAAFAKHFIIYKPYIVYTWHKKFLSGFLKPAVCKYPNTVNNSEICILLPKPCPWMWHLMCESKIWQW